jgi:hypothetical protein
VYATTDRAEIIAHFTKFINKNNPPHPRMGTPCWTWRGRLDAKGYAKVNWRRCGHQYAYRMSYVLFVGPIPEGLEIDHVCKIRNCVNPAHLEPVTHVENMRRSSGEGRNDEEIMRYKRDALIIMPPMLAKITRTGNVNIRIDGDVKAALDAAASMLGMSPSEWVRRAIVSALDRSPK